MNRVQEAHEKYHGARRGKRRGPGHDSGAAVKPEWEVKTLGEVATLQRGMDLPTQDRTPGVFPLVSSSGISDSHNMGPISGPGVVTGRSGSIGNVFYIENDFWPLNTVLYVKDFHGNDPRFVYYLLQKFDLKRFASGTGVPTLNRNFVHDELVGRPPLGEQQRIVAFLDEAFAGIATAKSHAERNLQNARALFESHLNAVFTQRGEGWVETTLGEACAITSGGTPSRSNLAFWKGNIPWVSAKDLKSDRIFDGLLHISENAVMQSATRMAPIGSLLILVRGMGLANGIPIAEVTAPVAFNQDIRALVLPKTIVPRFLLLSLKSSVLRGESEQLLSTAAHGTLKIDADKLRGMVFQYPSPSEQAGIVSDLDSISEEVVRLESLYQRKVAALDELKQSLLHEAFAMGH